MSLLSDHNASIYISSDSMVNSLGFDTPEVLTALKGKMCGSRSFPNYTQGEPSAMLSAVSKNQFYQICDQKRTIKHLQTYTFLEQMMIFVIQNALDKTDIDPADEQVLFLISTTKGNIDLLQKVKHDFPFERVYIWKSAELITKYFKNPNRPLIVSNACISGTQAIIKGAEIARNGIFKHVIVCGADCITPFVVSGFQSFKALSPEMCRPFDLNRKGLNIGEGAAAVILSRGESDKIRIYSGSVTNDANHISGPSRTGEGLYRAIREATLKVPSDQISFINAHGTATPYNDEMESIAIGRAELTHVPVNSLKANFGHTLGAAGVMETIIAAHCLKEEIILPSLGFETLGVSQQLNIPQIVIKDTKPYCIKTASGFGGCNATLVLKKGGLS